MIVGSLPARPCGPGGRSSVSLGPTGFPRRSGPGEPVRFSKDPVGSIRMRIALAIGEDPVRSQVARDPATIRTPDYSETDRGAIAGRGRGSSLSRIRTNRENHAPGRIPFHGGGRVRGSGGAHARAKTQDEGGGEQGREHQQTGHPEAQAAQAPLPAARFQGIAAGRQRVGDVSRYQARRRLVRVGACPAFR